MNWINWLLIKLIQIYLVVIFYFIITIFSLIKKITNNSPINKKNMYNQKSYWVEHSGLLFMSTRNGSLIYQSAKMFIKDGKIDYLLILILLIPIKYLLKIDKTETIDPSLYVMY
tara:strand:+ start:3862 stop:4203 length:342 start_codon:yes stop_codon:yes gene_type:complete